jgi:hypothetical protein
MPSRGALDRRYRERQNALAGGVARVLSSSLAAMPDLGEESLGQYVSRAHPTVAGGQKAAADGAAGYVTALVRPTDRARRAELDTSDALRRSGVLVTPESRSLVAPVLRARRLVAEGEAVAVAIDAAQSYAGALASLDLQAAQRVGLDAGAAASDAEIEGWEKDVGGDACDWCQAIAGNTYDDPEAVPFHENDRCSVVPIIAGESRSTYTYTEDDIPF